MEVLLGIALVLVLVGILGLAVLLVRQQRQLAAAGARLRPGAPAAAPRPESRPAEPLPAEALEQVRTQALEQARTEVLEQARIEA